MKYKQTFGLIEISKWKSDNVVSLPKVQRSFVWKPYQIENLWDSLLRGFPIGSFVLSPNEPKALSKNSQEEAEFEILDGQQRVTSIMLGMGEETFRESAKSFRVFIDLNPPKDNSSRKYIFRVITKSHPWGYKMNDNTKTLSADEIRNALDEYNVEDYLRTDLEKFYPFDANLPVPFEYFVKFNDPDKIIEELDNWTHWKRIMENWSRNLQEQTEHSGNGFQKPTLSGKQKNREIKRKIEYIHTKVKRMLSDEEGQKVPVLYLDFNKFRYEVKDEVENNAADEELKESDGDNENKEDEIENLFIRLNSGGTPLRGEDLNYSMLKARIDSKIQDDIENRCKGLFTPSRFITVAYRLYQHRTTGQENPSVLMRIKPKDFQRSIDNEIGKFQDFIVSLISDPIQERSLTLLEYVKKLLKFDSKDNSHGLPFMIVSKISESAPELMFLLLYRVLHKKDRFEPGSDLHKCMLGMMTLFMWLGKGEGNRDHSKLLRHIWPCAVNLPLEVFWSKYTVERAQLFEVLAFVENFKTLKKEIKSVKNPRADTKISNKFWRVERFINMMLKSNRDLVLYSQRKFLTEFFDEAVFGLDDTNVPFDWDHIFPHDLIKNKRRIPVIIKEWFNTIGNFRAWPYSMNRTDQKKSPEEKFHPYVDKRWKEFMIKWKIKTEFQLHKSLREWSFCDKTLADSSNTDVRKDYKHVFELIRDRNLQLSETWYRQLQIDKLLPPGTNEKFTFDMMINKDFWQDLNQEPDVSKALKLDKLQKGLICKAHSLGYPGILIYLLFDENRKETLENGVEFGIVVRYIRPKNYLKNIERTRLPLTRSDSKSKPHLFGNTFQLISLNEYSYTKLLLDFKNWLICFPNDIGNSLSDMFVNSLSEKYRQKNI